MGKIYRFSGSHIWKDRMVERCPFAFLLSLTVFVLFPMIVLCNFNFELIPVSINLKFPLSKRAYWKRWCYQPFNQIKDVMDLMKNKQLGYGVNSLRLFVNCLLQSEIRLWFSTFCFEVDEERDKAILKMRYLYRRWLSTILKYTVIDTFKGSATVIGHGFGNIYR